MTKRWAGLRELFTDADTYVVEVSPYAVDPLRSLAVATCLIFGLTPAIRAIEWAAGPERFRRRAPGRRKK